MGVDADTRNATVPDLLIACGEALGRAGEFLGAVGEAVSRQSGNADQILDTDQTAAHGYAWAATYVEALRQMLGWATRLEQSGSFTNLEHLIVQAAFGEYLAQLYGGIPLSQGEIIRPRDMGVESRHVHDYFKGAVKTLAARGNTQAVRQAIADQMKDGAATGNFGDPCLDDEGLRLMGEQFRRFARDRIEPFAQAWHLADDLIPMDLIGEMAELGVFGLTVPEAWGGLGQGKLAMCVVTEELSRGYLGVGSLGTRNEIAAELILSAGTEEQKQAYLGGLASGEILPTAVFTEPEAGSDLASIRTRAVRDGDGYRITGTKIWITHGARSDLMTLLARTDTGGRGHGGLSMFLVEKPRGTADTPFPADGMEGSEIPVLGYRGMREYEIAFDNFRVPATALLGGREGEGFKQLMATFETARIQTAARAVGVARNALELGVAFATERRQFGKPIHDFPRVGGKLAWMAVETMIARQLTYFAARQKDLGRRTDMEAGMAKLLATRAAWAGADNALQIHGGSGYATEHPTSRLLCDARILNIFEGTGEIQAHVIARGLLSGRN